jgi:hypothetical protein
VGRWACWFGHGVAGLGLITSLSIIWPSASGLYGLLIVDYLLFVVWVLWASISLYRSEKAAVGATAAGEARTLAGR